MATKQWIGIEEAATKYQVSTRRIITWCKRQEIIYSEVGDYLMLDENSLTDCLERNIRFSLSEEEHKRRMDEKMKENGKGFFPVTVKDLVGNEKFSASTGWITKPASKTYGKAQNNREWEIVVADGVES